MLRSTTTFRMWLGGWLALAGCMFALNASAANPPEVSHDGLHLVKEAKFDLAYLRPGADFSIYKRISLLDCGVAFKKDWKREQNRSASYRVTQKDMDEIRAKLGELFNEIMLDEMQTKGKLPVVDVAEEDVLILRPAIIDLDVAVPGAADMSPGRSRTFATSAGGMTLYMELYDSASGEIIARIAERDEARDNHRMMWQNSATNRAEAERIIRRWATMLREGLERVQAMQAPLAP